MRRHLMVALLFVLLAYLLRYLPITFFNLLILGLFRNLIALSWAIAKKREKVFVLDSMGVDARSGTGILISLVKIPYYYSWVWIYCIMTCTKGKLDKKIAYSLAIRWIFNLPM